MEYFILFIDMQKQIINKWDIMVKMENPCILCIGIEINYTDGSQVSLKHPVNDFE